ncbi:MAG: MopE-related protein [Deltaproteobacteria bacterium]|jgi:hypothetical protein
MIRSWLALALLAVGCGGESHTPDSGAGRGADASIDAAVPPGTDAPVARIDTGVCVPTIEICGDRRDQNCDGRDTSCGDTDRDGIQACREGDDLSLCDCDDSNPAVYPPSGGGAVPGGAERCDGLDNNCNMRVDEAAECCAGCASLGAERDRGDLCVETGECDCSTEPGLAVCPVGQTCCVSGCVDTRTDIDNCGLCGAACTAQSDRCAPGPTGVGECRCGGAPPCAFITMCTAGRCG